MNAKPSKNLRKAAKAILDGSRQKSRSFLQAEINQESDSVDAWLMHAWSSESFSETEEALYRVLELDSENATALSGLEWMSGIQEVTAQLDVLEERTDESRNVKVVADSVDSDAEAPEENSVSADGSNENAEEEVVAQDETDPEVSAETAEEVVAEDQTEEVDEEEVVAQDETDPEVSAETAEEVVAEDQTEEEDEEEVVAQEETDPEVSAEPAEEVVAEDQTEEEDEKEVVAESEESDESSADETVAEAKEEAEDSSALSEADVTEVARLEAEKEQAEAAKAKEEAAEASRLADEAEAARVEEEAAAEAARQAEEAEVARQAEAARKAEEAEAARKAEEAEAARKVEEQEELQRLADEAEAKRVAKEEAQAAAKAKEEAEAAAKAKAAAEAQAAAKEEATRVAEEAAAAEKAASVAAAAAAATAAAAVAVTSTDVEQTIQDDLNDLSAEVQETIQQPAVAPPTVQVADEELPLVLAVDDSPTIRKLLTMTLERKGFQVVTAADGVEALTLLSEQLPDVILSDINMPRLGGYQLCKFVKKYDRTKHIPVIMLSGKDGVFDKMRGKMAGCNDYIVKPFESSELIAKVREHARVSV